MPFGAYHVSQYAPSGFQSLALGKYLQKLNYQKLKNKLNHCIWHHYLLQVLLQRDSVILSPSFYVSSVLNLIVLNLDPEMFWGRFNSGRLGGNFDVLAHNLELNFLINHPNYPCWNVPQDPFEFDEWNGRNLTFLYKYRRHSVYLHSLEKVFTLLNMLLNHIFLQEQLQVSTSLYV